MIISYLARLWRTNGAAKGELRQFTPPSSMVGVDELAQSHSPEPNWRTNWRGIGALAIRQHEAGK